MAFDAGAALDGKNPVRHKISAFSSLLNGQGKHLLPNVRGNRAIRMQRPIAPSNVQHFLLPVKPTEIFSDSVTLLKTYTEFSMIENYGIGWKKPVHNSLTKIVNVVSIVAH